MIKLNSIRPIEPSNDPQLDIEKARDFLISCRDVEDVRDFRDKAAAVARYLRISGASRDSACRAAIILRRAERRLGEICIELPKNQGTRHVPGGRTVLPPGTAGNEPLLRDLGISKTQSSRWQATARVPEPDFESYLADCLESHEFPTVNGLIAPVRRAERVENLERIAKGNHELNMPDRYPIVLADPPWRYEHVKTESRAIENQYPTMALEEICALPLVNVTTPDAVLFLWVTAPKLEEGMAVLRAWGFAYRTCAVWDKERMGMGYYFRQQHELLLVATKGSPPTPAPSDRVSSVLRAKRDQKHSAKPVEFYGVIEGMYPTLPKLEMFCRQARKGWSAWGNQS